MYIIVSINDLSNHHWRTSSLYIELKIDIKKYSVFIGDGLFSGMIELVTKAETLRKIQVEHGLTGSFKDKPIAEWLAKHNPSELENARAVQNFTGIVYLVSKL